MAGLLTLPALLTGGGAGAATAAGAGLSDIVANAAAAPAVGAAATAPMSAISQAAMAPAVGATVPDITELGQAKNLANFVKMFGTGVRLGEMAGVSGEQERPQQGVMGQQPQGMQPQAPAPVTPMNYQPPRPTALTIMDLLKAKRGW